LLDRAGSELKRRYVRTSSGLDLAYAESGAGAPIILIHGTLTAAEDLMLGLGDALAPRHRVIAFDRPGFGRSGVRRLRDAGIHSQAASLLEGLEALGIECPILVGHSFGASVAVAMAIDAPDRIGGVVALAPLVLPEPRAEQALFGPRSVPGAGDVLALVANGTGDRALLPSLWHAMFLPQVMPERVLANFPFAIAGTSDASVRVGEDAIAAPSDLTRILATARNCPVPVRILGGDRDIVVRNGANGRMLAALMPNATYKDLPGLGHMIQHFAVDDIVEVIGEIANQPSRRNLGPEAAAG
jgi:pimeloyl-ACP methyl ester carboxylesterase